MEVKDFKSMTDKEKASPKTVGQLEARRLLDAVVQQSTSTEHLSFQLEVLEELAFDILGSMAFNWAMQKGKVERRFDKSALKEYIGHTESNILASAYNLKSAHDLGLTSYETPQ